MRIERESVATTNAATTRMTISAATGAPSCSFVDERRCALDLCDFDARPGLEDLVRHECARRPLLAAEADAAAVVVDALHDDRACADERSGPGAHRRRHAEMCTRERTQDSERRERRAGEDDHLDRDAGADRGGGGRDDGGDGEW